MEYLVKLNDCDKVGICPHPEELQALISAALAAVPEYRVFTISVQKVDRGRNLSGDRFGDLLH